MTKIRRVDLWPDDALTGTVMLSDAEMGVYARIWLLIYSTGGPIQIDHLRSVCRGHGNTFNHILKRLETLGKIQRNGREIDQKRCRIELERAANRHQKAHENASNRWKNKDIADADALLPSNARAPDNQLQQPTYNKEESPDGDSPPVSPKEVKSNGRTGKTRISADWRPDEQNRQYARDRGIDPDWLIADFIDYWTDPDSPHALKSDWSRTWQRRCRDLQSRQRGNGAARPRQDVGRNQGVVAVVGKLIAEEEGWGVPD